MPGHTTAEHSTVYKVYGTNEEYVGLTVEIGGFQYSTRGGALEGDSMQLVATATSTTNPNPVTRTFVSRVTYYRADGTPVPPGSNLHQHADGTIMLGHDPNNMGVIVTTQNPNTGNQTLGGDGLTTNTNVNGTGTNNNQVGGSPSNQNQPSPQSGGMGGGGSY